METVTTSAQPKKNRRRVLLKLSGEVFSNDVLVVAPPDGGKDQLFPNHPDVVLEVNPAEGRLVIRPLVYLE